jgi:hypothetical protein
MFSVCGHAAIPKKYIYTKQLFFQTFFTLSKKAQNPFYYSNLVSYIALVLWHLCQAAGLKFFLKLAEGRQPRPKSTDFHAGSRSNVSTIFWGGGRRA